MEDCFDLLCGIIKVMLLIEMLLVVFQMDEILYVLCDYIVGLNCGCWDYIFSYIKMLKNYLDCVLLDWQVVMMDKFFFSVYLCLLIKICYKCGVFVMGGMVVFILSKDIECNCQVLSKVIVDKELEVNNGYDGIWIVYLGLVDIVMVVFDCVLGDKLNQFLVIWSEDVLIIVE